ncbi:MAG: S1 family peptidase [Wenzhouxiangella sp.]
MNHSPKEGQPRHLKAVSFASTFVVSTLLLVSSAVASSKLESADIASDQFIPDELAEVIARDLGWDASDLSEILAAEHEASLIATSAHRVLDENYAGSWLERDERGFPRLVVATTSLAESRAAVANLNQHRSNVAVEVREVRFSAKQLDGVVDALNSAAGFPLARSLPDVYAWGIDLPSNRVVVVTAPNVSEDALDFIAASRVNLDAVVFEESAYAPSTLANIVGGFRYDGCSIGFAVRRGATPGFATAGHCGSVGNIARINGVAVGRYQRSNFPGADAAWVNVRQSDNLFNLVWRYSGNQTYAIRGSNDAALGATVCRSGWRTGWRCGTLTRNNVTVNYPQGSVTGLRESNACAGQGDSGGSWVAGGNQAQGVTSGGALGNDGTNCGIPQNQRRSWFQRLNPMLSAYGLTLVTN